MISGCFQRFFFITTFGENTLNDSKTELHTYRHFSIDLFLINRMEKSAAKEYIQVFSEPESGDF